MCFCEDGESPEFSSEVWRLARKEHFCCECERKIAKGSKYYYVAGRWDGDFHEFVTCQRCMYLRAAHHAVDGCNALLGGLLESIRFCVSEEGRDYAKELQRAFRRAHWGECSRFERYAMRKLPQFCGPKMARCIRESCYM